MNFPGETTLLYDQSSYMASRKLVIKRKFKNVVALKFAVFLYERKYVEAYKDAVLLSPVKYFWKFCYQHILYLMTFLLDLDN